MGLAGGPEWETVTVIAQNGYRKGYDDALAHLADVLGSDETRRAVRAEMAEMTMRAVEQRDPDGPIVLDAGDQADAALAAVREVLGLPGGGA